MKDLNIIKKAFYWCFNFSNPEEWIEYVAEGKGVMYNHFMDKWKYYCKIENDSAVAFLALFCSMSDSYQDRLCEYIYNNYINKDKE